jgi:hypothetical protein
VGIKIFGPDLSVIERLGQEVERTLQRVDGTRSVYAERVTQGYFTDITIDRAAIARYGLTVADVQDVSRLRSAAPPAHGRRPRALPVSVRYQPFSGDLTDPAAGADTCARSAARPARSSLTRGNDPG